MDYEYITDKGTIVNDTSDVKTEVEYTQPLLCNIKSDTTFYIKPPTEMV